MSEREALEEARHNIRRGVAIAVQLKESAESEEVRKLATALHLIGHGVDQIARIEVEHRVDGIGQILGHGLDG